MRPEPKAKPTPTPPPADADRPKAAGPQHAPASGQAAQAQAGVFADRLRQRPSQPQTATPHTPHTPHPPAKPTAPTAGELHPTPQPQTPRPKGEPPRPAPGERRVDAKTPETQAARPSVETAAATATTAVKPRREERDERPAEGVGGVAVAPTAAVEAAPAPQAAAGSRAAWGAQVAQQVAEVVALRADAHGTTEATLALAAQAGGGQVLVQSLGNKRLRLKLITRDAEVKAASLTQALRGRGFEVVETEASDPNTNG